MPTYEYRCRSCETQFEIVQAFTDHPLTVHDDCGGELRKVFSPIGISFKGSGFYKTDSRSSSSGSSSKSDAKGDSSSSGSSSDKKSDAKTDTTSTKSEKKSEKKPDKKSEKKSA